MSILHQNATLHSLGSTATHPPRVKSIGWTVLDIIKMQTDRQIPAFNREKNMFSPLPPKLWIFGVDSYRSFQAQKMVFWWLSIQLFGPAGSTESQPISMINNWCLISIKRSKYETITMSLLFLTCVACVVCGRPIKTDWAIWPIRAE